MTPQNKAGGSASPAGSSALRVDRRARFPTGVEAQAHAATIVELEELLIRGRPWRERGGTHRGRHRRGSLRQQVSEAEVKAILGSGSEKVLSPVAKPLVIMRA